MTWDERCSRFRALHEAGILGEWRGALEVEIRRLLARPTAADTAWLGSALEDPERREFAALALRQAWRIPEPLFRPAIRAAIAGPDPGEVRALVDALVASFGHRAVNEALLETFGEGSDDEKVGAVRALYWAQPELIAEDRSRGYGVESASPDSRRAWLALSDVWSRKTRMFLEEFVHNPAPEVRSSLVPHLDLEPRRHPPELRGLVLEAARIALEHEDPYVRRRVEGVFGTQLQGRRSGDRYQREIAG